MMGGDAIGQALPVRVLRGELELELELWPVELPD
jgi:hypothetical protein